MKLLSLSFYLGLATAASGLHGAAQVYHQQEHDHQHPLQNPFLATPTGAEIPLLGFGTWNLRSEGHNASKAVQHALEVGYRHIDCAAIYGNEVDVGRGINRGLKAAGLKRQNIWVTSKLWNDHHGTNAVEQALKKTLADLGVGYLDLYLMHWPVKQDGKGQEAEVEFVETWRAMESLLNTKLVRNIGISNFSPAQLRQLLAHSRVKPYAHQMELHPYLPQSAWLQYHREQGIHVTAYSPLGNSNPTYDGKTAGPSSRKQQQTVDDNDEFDNYQQEEKLPKLMQHPTLTEIARKRRCTPATVALTWGMTRGTSVIPKSQHAERIEENKQACLLEYEDIRAIQLIGMANLTRFNNPSKNWGVDLYDGLQDA